MIEFHSDVLVHPGLGNSGENHWQTIWEKKYPQFRRIYHSEWNFPVCSEWIRELDNEVINYLPENLIIVAHSLACATVSYWAMHYRRKIKGVLLVGPSDTEADSYPSGTKGFMPIPLIRLPFPSIVVMSANDPYVTLERASLFAEKWGSSSVNIGNAGHINIASGHGDWDDGFELLKRLDEL